MFRASNCFQYKTQNNWKHNLTFRETISHIVKSNEWQKHTKHKHLKHQKEAAESRKLFTLLTS